jgi:hypothetical protein
VRAALAFVLVSVCIAAPGCGNSGEVSRSTTPDQESTEQLVRVPWSVERSGLPRVEAETVGVWIASLGGEVWFPRDDGSVVSNVFRLDPDTLEAQRLPLGRVVDYVFSDEGLLWVIEKSVTDRPMGVSSVGLDLSLERKRADACPGSLGSRSVAFGGRLWLDCGHRVLVFEPAHAAAVAEYDLPRLSALLKAPGGLWAATDRELRCLAGRCTGRTIELPDDFLAEADYATLPGWDLDGDEAWAHGLLGDGFALVRVDLRSGEVRTSPLPPPNPTYDDISVVGTEVWIADSSTWSIRRFERAIPARPLGELSLPTPPPREDRITVWIDRGAGWVWITTFGSDAVLYRAPIPGS